MNQNRIYIVLTFVLIILSGLALWYFFWPSSSPKLVTLPTPVPTIAPIDTQSDLDSIIEKPTPTPTRPVAAISPTPTTMPEYLELSSRDYSFYLRYSPLRKLYETSENGGARYTLYSPKGNITLHVGSSWSWIHPGRTFTDSFLVNGRSTFVYHTSTQTITDFSAAGLNYTLQCVHNGDTSIKKECEDVLSSFLIAAGS